MYGLLYLIYTLVLKLVQQSTILWSCTATVSAVGQYFRLLQHPLSPCVNLRDKPWVAGVNENEAVGDGVLGLSTLQDILCSNLVASFLAGSCYQQLAKVA